MSNNELILCIGLIISFATAIFSLMRNRQAIKKATWEATNEIYKEWWSDELKELRQSFYEKLTLIYDKSIPIKELKEMESMFPDDFSKIRKLCYFFDRVGWLGAAKLIDIDYILAPMQHSVRRVWMTMEPFIQNERIPSPNKLLDPVYLSGFEWLFKHTEENPQAELINNKFNNPKLLSDKEYRDMQNEIFEDEKRFCEKYLKGKI
jgi:hypothetical protein